ncbi:MAG: hypothetical protein JWP00_3632 [Chloroflexi bacterium]|jgi:hypothetical protein|nr:hypothetical protein [Chloroflexota bacterium]
MSFNPAFDPRSERDKNMNPQSDPQFRADQQYVREIANQNPAYNQAQYANSQPAQSYTPASSGAVYSPPVQTHAPSVPRTVTSTPIHQTEVNTYDAPRLRDRVRWGPILAGLVATLASLLVLSLLGVAVGLTAATGDPAGGAAAATDRAGNYGAGAAIWAAISALIAFFIGGFVAAHTAGVRGKDNGWINGALVWAVALPLLLWFASSGASGFLNAIGFNLQGFTNTVSSTVNNPGTNPVNTDPATVQRATEAARNGAWGALLALLLGLAAAGLGGLLGGRDRHDKLDINDGAPRQDNGIRNTLNH